MPNPISSQLASVFIHVRDLPRARDFYSLLLEIPYDPKNAFGDTIYVIPLANGTDLVLDANNSQQIAPDNPFTLHATCMFPTEDMDAAYAWLQAQGTEIVTEIFRDPAVSFFNFKDPDGNIQMICQRARS
jgi:predicted enzyme related to lactoylglutathione lyase